MLSIISSVSPFVVERKSPAWGPLLCCTRVHRCAIERAANDANHRAGGLVTQNPAQPYLPSYYLPSDAHRSQWFGAQCICPFPHRRAPHPCLAPLGEHRHVPSQLPFRWSQTWSHCLQHGRSVLFDRVGLMQFTQRAKDNPHRHGGDRLCMVLTTPLTALNSQLCASCAKHLSITTHCLAVSISRCVTSQYLTASITQCLTAFRIRKPQCP